MDPEWLITARNKEMWKETEKDAFFFTLISFHVLDRLKKKKQGVLRENSHLLVHLPNVHDGWERFT